MRSRSTKLAAADDYRYSNVAWSLAKLGPNRCGFELPSQPR